MKGPAGTLAWDTSLITIHVSCCCCFSAITISQGSVATRFRCYGIFYYYYYFVRILLLSCVSKRILKIGQKMAKLEAKYSGTFLPTYCRTYPLHFPSLVYFGVKLNF